MKRQQRNDSGKAIDTRDAAASLHEAGLYQAGLAHMRAGRYLDAQPCCPRALALHPPHAHTLHLMGLLSLQAQRYDQAVEWIGLAVRQDPRTEYLANLGNTLRQC